MRQSGYTFSLTRHLILRSIWLEPGISRSDLARRLELNKSTITTATTDLEALRIIRSAASGVAGPKGGRKPVGLEIDPTFGFILGLELGTDRYVAVGVSVHGTILFSECGPVEWQNKSIAEVLREILRLLEGKIEGVGTPLLGVGLGAPGTIDSGTGIIYHSGPLEISDPLNFGELCRDISPLPMMIENDGNCCAWGELVFRKDQCPDNFLFIMGEFRPHAARSEKVRVPSIGLGLVLGRKIQYGELNTSGEFQSVFHSPKFLNSFSIADGLIGKLEEDPGLMERMIRELAQNMALIVNVLNLGAVIVGGSFEAYRELIESIFLEEIEKNWPTPQAFPRTILFSQLKENAVAYGAAAMFVEKLFSLPEHSEDLLAQMFAARGRPPAVE